MLQASIKRDDRLAIRETLPPPAPARPVLGRRFTIGFILLLAIAPSFDRDLYEPDEGRYAEIARQMLISGDWLVPRLEGVEHLAKPPLTYWMSAAGIAVFGDTAFGARALVIVAGVLIALLVLDLGTSLGTPAEGNLAALVYATSAMPFALGHFLSADVFVTLWQVAGVAAAARAWKSEPRETRRWALASWLCFGLAFMTKGPPGLLALVPIVVVDVRRARQGRRPLVWSWTGLLLCAAVGLWWYLLLVFEDGARLHYFLVGEVWNRVFTDAHRRENTPWLHIGALTIGILPWAFGYLEVGRSVRAWWRTTSRRIADEPLLLVVWIIPALVVFLIARSRLPLYTAPLVCPIAVLFARAWCRRPAGPPALARSKPALFAIAALMVTGLHFLRASQGAPEIRAASEAVRADKQSAAVILNATGFPRGSLAFFAGRDVETRAPGEAVPDGRDVYLVRSAKDAHPLPETAAAATEIFRGKKFAVLRLKRRGE